MPASATPEPVIRQIVEAMRTLAGPHPGFRPVHAQGLVCSGTFRPSPDAPRVTRAPHFSGQSPTLVRFANANGNPDVHDGVPNVRSMAVKFQFADGKSADILGNSVEGFIARTPEELLEFLRAQLRDPASGRPDPDAVPRFLAGHPGGRGFVERLMTGIRPGSQTTRTITITTSGGSCCRARSTGTSRGRPLRSTRAPATSCSGRSTSGIISNRWVTSRAFASRSTRAGSSTATTARAASRSDRTFFPCPSSRGAGARCQAVASDGLATVAETGAAVDRPAPVTRRSTAGESFGSSVSRMPSPSRLNASTVMVIASPGKSTSHQ
jgi:catalase